MRLPLFASASRGSSAVGLTLAALAFGASHPGPAAALQMGVGPAECVQAAPHSECGALDAAYQPAGAIKPNPKTARAKTGAGKKTEVEAGKGNEELAASKAGEPFRFFSPESFWNTSLAAEAPLDLSSTAIVGRFLAEIEREKHTGIDPTINTKRWSVPIYTVPADQPTVEVAHRNGGTSRALQAAWTAVPLPPDAEPAAGSDAHLVVWQPSSDKLWEFWHLNHEGESWSAPWGGAMERVSTSDGVYGPSSWPGATSQWGGSASSLSLAGGLITLEDLERGEIDHALAIGIPDVRAGAYSLPAERTDGRSSDPLSLPEGAHLRLNPELDLSSLNLPPLTLMIAKAAQRYGLIVRSLGSHVVFYGQDPTLTGTNPYAGKAGFFEGREPSELLSSFPWKSLQLLQMSLFPSS